MRGINDNINNVNDKFVTLMLNTLHVFIVDN
jgi:hypothetical protein